MFFFFFFFVICVCLRGREGGRKVEGMGWRKMGRGREREVRQVSRLRLRFSSYFETFLIRFLWSLSWGYNPLATICVYTTGLNKIPGLGFLWATQIKWILAPKSLWEQAAATNFHKRFSSIRATVKTSKISYYLSL